MADLHEALQTLSPVSFSTVPTGTPELQSYLQDAFSKCQVLIDSVPPPPIDATVPTSRPRSSTSTSGASNVSEVSASSARSDLINPAHAVLQKEWGKPIKLSAKDNPLGMGVFKLGGKDGRGAWFARRSVHEGLSFTKWKKGLEKEFHEGLNLKGSEPGQGNVRGIGGERRVEQKVVDGVGAMEVFHLSAQFPGPTTPRDFVTLLLTSSAALKAPVSPSSSPLGVEKGDLKYQFSDFPRHFMMISKPCDHPECPERSGYIRGRYESIEFIREIPKTPRRSSSTTNLLDMRRHNETTTLNKEAIVRHARQQSEGLETMQNAVPLDKPALSRRTSASEGGRARGKTISFAESRGFSAKGEAMDLAQEEDDEAEINPVEWIMITRSDPGGSVPRFLVERGTPSGIVSDASKFLDWACKKQHMDTEDGIHLANGSSMIRPQFTKDAEPALTNGRLVEKNRSEDSHTTSNQDDQADVLRNSTNPHSSQNSGFLSSVANAAYAGIETYAPQSIIDRLPAHPSTPTSSSALQSQDIPSTNSTKDNSDSISTVSSVSISASFASAEEHFSDSLSARSTVPSLSSQTATKTTSTHEKELAKLAVRKAKLDEKLQKTHEKELRDKEALTEKQLHRLKRAEEKHAKELEKAEAKHQKEIAALEAKRAKEAKKEEERKKKAEDKDERTKLQRERDEARGELEIVRQERDATQEALRELQTEDTILVAAMGKLPGGQEVLNALRGSASTAGTKPASLKKGRDGKNVG